MSFGDRQKIKARPLRVPTADTRSVKPPEKHKDTWLYTPEHRKWSRDVIARSGGMCQGKDHNPALPRAGIRLYADHLVERRDSQNIADLLGSGQALCGSCHSRVTAQRRAARMAKKFGSDPRKVAASWHPDWLRQAVIPFAIICGPPASGKNTFAASIMGRDDLLIDLDEIMGRLSCDPTDKAWLNVALRQRNEMLADITRACPWPAAYLVIGEPSAERRQWWADRMGAKVYLMIPSRSVCEERIKADRIRPQHDLLEAVSRWFAAYSPRVQDVLVG